MLIQINTLYSLEDVGPQYSFDTETLEVINTDTYRVKKVSTNKRGYPVVYLQRSTNNRHGREARNVPMHKIVALAVINNGPYTLIEHLDDDKQNYTPQNLVFSDQKSNVLRMHSNGIQNHHDRVFELEMSDGKRYVGTMKTLSAETGIPRATLYDRYYRSRRNGKRQIKSIVLAESQSKEGPTTRERVASANAGDWSAP